MAQAKTFMDLLAEFKEKIKVEALPEYARAHFLKCQAKPTCTTTHPLKIEELPEELRKSLDNIKSLISDVVTTFRVAFRVSEEEARAKWGAPFWTVEDFLALAYLVVYNCVQPATIAKYIGMSPRTLSEKIDKFVETGKVTVLTSYEEARSVLDRIKMGARVVPSTTTYTISLEDMCMFITYKITPIIVKPIILPGEIEATKLVQEFRKFPTKIEGVGFYVPKQISDSISALRDLVDGLLKFNADRGLTIPTNPDVWVEAFQYYKAGRHEDVKRLLGVDFKTFVNILVEVIEKYVCAGKTGIDLVQCKRETMKAIHRFQPLYGLFQMKIGKAIAKPKREIEILTLKDYEKLKTLTCEEIRKAVPKAPCKEEELKAYITIARLHIVTGAREGYTSTTISKGDRLADLKGTSLIGLTWDAMTFDHEKRVVTQIKVYESKTKTEWVLNHFVIDPELPSLLYEIYEKTGGVYDNVVYSILRYYGVKHIDTVARFQEFYTRYTELIGLALGKYTLTKDGKESLITPHSLRASHISILAELRIPLEIATSPHTGLGVGWDDLKTAKEYYLVFTQALINEYIAQAFKLREAILKGAGT
jgi:DNA-binding Lrp family transcriptional regulator